MDGAVCGDPHGLPNGDPGCDPPPLILSSDSVTVMFHWYTFIGTVSLVHFHWYTFIGTFTHKLSPKSYGLTFQLLNCSLRILNRKGKELTYCDCRTYFCWNFDQCPRGIGCLAYGSLSCHDVFHAGVCVDGGELPLLGLEVLT